MISVIVATRSRYTNVRKTLEALNNQSVPRDQYEIILSDDNSTDETQTLINEQKGLGRFKYVFNNHKPHSWNASVPRNLGALVTDPETVGYYFVDSDVMVPRIALACVLEDYEKNKDRVIIGPYHWWNRDGDGVLQNDIRFPKFEQVTPDETFDKVTDGLACFGGNLFIPKEIFWSVNGFSNDTHIGLEDGDMGLKLWKKQTKFSYDIRLLGQHQWHETPPDRFPPNMKEYIDALNMKHFGTKEPDYGIVEASRESYAAWGITGWQPPKEWLANQLDISLKVNKI